MSSLMTTAAPITGAGSDYGSTELAAKTAYNNALIKLNGQRQGTLRSYGYNANFDPGTGVMSGLSVDPNNPYGQLQNTLRNQSQEDDQALYGSENRGLHGGLANQAVSNLNYTHQGQTSQLASNLMGTMADYAGQQKDASDTYNNTLYQAQLDATRNALLQQMFNTPDYSGLNYDPYSDPNTLPPNNTISDGGYVNAAKNPATKAKAKVVAKVISAIPHDMRPAPPAPKKVTTGGARGTKNI